MSFITINDDVSSSSYKSNILLLGLFPLMALTSSAVDRLDVPRESNSTAIVYQKTDFTGYNLVSEPSQENLDISLNKAQIFSGFVNNLIENMQNPPAEVHKKISETPWDFV